MTDYTSFEIRAVDGGFIVDREWFDAVDPNADPKTQPLWDRRRSNQAVITSWDEVIKFLTDNKVVAKPTK